MIRWLKKIGKQQQLGVQYWWLFSVHVFHGIVCFCVMVIAALLAARQASPDIEIGYSALLFCAVATGIHREVSKQQGSLERFHSLTDDSLRQLTSA
jgi:hypothetical protein